MNHPNMYIVALALATFANIASPEMARDLAFDLEKMLGSGNSYIRKKAVLAVVRVIRKAPELVENFFERGRALLSEKNHGVILTGVTLLLEMCKLDTTGQVALQCRQVGNSDGEARQPGVIAVLNQAPCVPHSWSRSWSST